MTRDAASIALGTAWTYRSVGHPARRSRCIALDLASELRRRGGGTGAAGLCGQGRPGRHALGTGIAYILNYRLITDEGTTASVVTYLLPIVAVIFGAAILNDHVTPQIIGGMLIVLIGVAITRRDHPASEPRNDLPEALPNLAVVDQGGSATPRRRPGASTRPLALAAPAGRAPGHPTQDMQIKGGSHDTQARYCAQPSS